MCRSTTLTAALAVAATLLAAPAITRAAGPPVPQFQAGDRWSAVGDSITHGGSYHDDVYLFYVTRFPDRKFDMTNAGISGDSSWGTLTRYDWDVAAYHPTIATIMLGMNDVGRPLYDQPETETLAKQRKYLLDRYAVSMRELAAKLKASGAKVILLTPSIYDQTVVFEPKTADEKVSPPTPAGTKGTNDALIEAADRVRKIGRDLDLPVVDLNTPMLAINAEKQKTDRHYTLIGRDRIHPGETGHFVMAYELLKAQQVPGEVAKIGVDARRRRASGEERCRVTDVKAENGGGVSFTVQADALPYPITPGQQAALELVPFRAEMDREPLIVTGLKPGKYALSLDGTSLGTWDADQLAAGVDLAAVTGTPDYQQALAVREMDQKRHAILRDHLRTIAFVEYRGARDGITPGNAGDAATLDRVKALVPKIQGSYNQGLYNRYILEKPRETQYRADLAKATDDEWAAAQPKPHRYVLTPAAP